MSLPLPFVASAPVPGAASGAPVASKGAGRAGADTDAGALLPDAVAFAALAAPDAAPAGLAANAMPIGGFVRRLVPVAAGKADGPWMGADGGGPVTAAVTGGPRGQSLPMLVGAPGPTGGPLPASSPLLSITGATANTASTPQGTGSGGALPASPEPVRPTATARAAPPAATTLAVPISAAAPTEVAGGPTPSQDQAATPAAGGTPNPSAPSAPHSAGGTAPPGPAQQVAQAVAQASVHAPGERVVEVRLDPPHLGRVRIEFDFTGDAVRAVVSAAEPEALSLLRRGGAGLARELAEMGYEGAEVEYAEDRADHAGRDERAGRAFALPAPLAGPSEHAAPAKSVRRHDGALDITL